MRSVPQQQRLRNLVLLREAAASRTVCNRILSGLIQFLPVLVLIALAGCASRNSVPPPPAAPSNLQYAQSTINATVGVAVSIAAPTVTGTVSSYAVSPALPAGLSLSTSTGAISGTPTTVTAQATYTVTASNSGGSTSTSLKIAVNPVAPSNLVYPQTTITAVVGQSISQDVPTVSGTVTSFSVSPALPSGLSINASTGAISGTPTTVTAQATYTVTASNAGGSTTAGVQISVNPATPSLTYAQTAVNAIQGLPTSANIPVIQGTGFAFSISPALPAGMSIDSALGVIYGTPSASAAATVYTVTARSSAVSATAKVTIGVAANHATKLLDLGMIGQGGLRVAGDRVLSFDHVGRWELWQYSTQTEIAYGDIAGFPAGSREQVADLAGSTVAIELANGMEIHSAVDGHLVTWIPYAGLLPGGGTAWHQLATDGSYIVIGSVTDMSIYGPTGTLLVRKLGDYANAKAYAAPGQVQVLRGAAGANVVETVSVADGSSTVSAPFVAALPMWSFDGQHFMEWDTTNSTVSVYSKDGTQTGATVTIPGQFLYGGGGGTGNWIWGPDQSGNVAFYGIGSGTASLSVPGTVIGNQAGSGNLVAIAPSAAGKVTLVDVSGATPVATDYSLPYPNTIFTGGDFCAVSSGEWVIGANAILDGASLGGTVHYFGHGQAATIAGGGGYAAVATQKNEVLDYDLAGPTLVTTLPFHSDRMFMSADGSILGAASIFVSTQQPVQPLQFFSLPSGATISSFTYNFNTVPTMEDFSMAGNGSTFGLSRLITNTSSHRTYSRTVTPLAGSPEIWKDYDIGTAPPLSPDGTLSAEFVQPGSANAYTNIYRNSALTATVGGMALVWLDNGRLLLDTFSQGNYQQTVIVAPDGTMLGTTPLQLPSEEPLQPIPTNPDWIYRTYDNTIYSLSTGSAVWTGSVPQITTPGGDAYLGTVSGDSIVYAANHTVWVEKY